MSIKSSVWSNKNMQKRSFVQGPMWMAAVLTMLFVFFVPTRAFLKLLFPDARVLTSWLMRSWWLGFMLFFWPICMGRLIFGWRQTLLWQPRSSWLRLLLFHGAFALFGSKFSRLVLRWLLGWPTFRGKEIRWRTVLRASDWSYLDWELSWIFTYFVLYWYKLYLFLYLSMIFEDYLRAAGYCLVEGYSFFPWLGILP